MNKIYTLRVYNTITEKYEDVQVTAEVYRTYKRSSWNIEDNNNSFYEHEIQFSQLIGGKGGAYENFREFISDTDATAEQAIDAIYKKKLYKAMKSLSESERSLIVALFFEGKTEREYAEEIGVYRHAVHKRKLRILTKCKHLIEN